MAAFVDAGIVAFDCADIYTGVEEMIGTFLARLAAARGAAAAGIRVHTKFVPDLAALSRIDRRSVARVIDRSLARLGRERLDLVQFHWWDFSAPGWTECAGHLAALQAAGKIDRDRGHQLRRGAPRGDHRVGRRRGLRAGAILAPRPTPGGRIPRVGGGEPGGRARLRGARRAASSPTGGSGSRIPASRSRTDRSSSTGSSSRSSGAGVSSRNCSGRSAASPTGGARTSPR